MGRLRLTGGELGGRFVEVPPGIRPTEGRVREALLSIWQPRLPDSRLLDLFAGSGAVALEALGRGARAIVLVERDARVGRILRGNLERLAPGRGWRLVASEALDAVRRLGERGERFDLVFADPPYAAVDYAALLGAAVGLLAAGGELAIEHPAGLAWPDLETEDVERLAERRYGRSALTRWQRAPGAGQDDQR